MRYDVKTYARAFVESAASSAKGDHAKIVNNFLAIVRKNGDSAKLPQILSVAGAMLREKEGISKIEIETARPLSDKLRKALHGLAEKNDVIEETVNPALVAGVRITRNEEEQFDMSLARKLQRIFT